MAEYNICTIYRTFNSNFTKDGYFYPGLIVCVYQFPWVIKEGVYFVKLYYNAFNNSR